MAYKSGISHAASALILTILSAVIIQFSKEYRFMDDFIRGIEKVSLGLIGILDQVFSIQLDVTYATPLLMGSILCFVWGVVYHRVRNRNYLTKEFDS